MQTDEDLRAVAKHIAVPVALVVRMAIEEKVASLMAGIEVSKSGKPLAQVEHLLTQALREVRAVIQ